MLSADEIITALEEMIEYASDHYAHKKEALNHPRNHIELEMMAEEIDRAQQVLDKIINAA